MSNAAYFISDFDGTGMLEIQKNDENSVYQTDAEAVEAAVADGISIIPVEELPETFDRRYFGWLDTPENRQKIKEYCGVNV